MYRAWQSLCLALFILCLSADARGADDNWTADWIFKAVPEGAVPLESSQKSMA
jgi:hypothetical protein